jgi:hypothetical protein
MGALERVVPSAGVANATPEEIEQKGGESTSCGLNTNPAFANYRGGYLTRIWLSTASPSAQVKDAGSDQQDLLVMKLCGLGLGCRGFDRPARWL